MRTVVVVGAGFAGLTVAFYLRELGFDVEIREVTDRPGGLIGTEYSEFGQVESAANALLVDRNVEKLFAKLGLEFAERGEHFNRKYIFWNGAKRWPLSLGPSVKLLGLAARGKIAGWNFLEPEPGETVANWCRRHVGGEVLERVVGPALQGIFAGDPEQMSANLVADSLLRGRGKKGEWSGSVAPKGGMQTLVNALEDGLKKSGCRFVYNKVYELPTPLTAPHIVATSGWRAGELLNTLAPSAAALLKSIEPLPLVRATLFFEKGKDDPHGFGCLFPAAEKFFSLGVLFNSDVFPDCSPYRSESYIIGGALAPRVIAAGDEQIIEGLLQDRERLTGKKGRPLFARIYRWPRAIPHYTVKWEKQLKALRVDPPLYLHGNYFGEIGLSRILARSKRLARTLKDHYG